MELALSQFCGPDDVITPVHGGDEDLRARLGFRGCQNFLLPPAFAGGPERRFFNHISAAKVKAMIDPWVWDNYYKFCFVRNSWDRVISEYWWYYRKKPSLMTDGPSLSEFIVSNKPRDLMSRKGLKLYMIDEAVVVDDIYRYEDLPEALDRIRDKLALPDRLVLPDAKAHIRKDRRPYWEVLSRGDAERIARIFSKEIKLHGYTFDAGQERKASQESWVTPVISQVTLPIYH